MKYLISLLAFTAFITLESNAQEDRQDVLNLPAYEPSANKEQIFESIAYSDKLRDFDVLRINDKEYDSEAIHTVLDTLNVGKYHIEVVTDATLKKSVLVFSEL